MTWPTAPTQLHQGTQRGFDASRSAHRATCLTLVAWSVFTSVAAAQALVHEPEVGDVQAAARAFSAGQQALVAGDDEAAARWFELAHGIAPAPEALRSALRARLASGHRARAATLALEASSRYGDDEETSGLAGQVLAQLEPELGLLAVRCDVPCALLIDGQAVTDRPSVQLELYLEPGLHTVVASFEARGRVAQTVTLPAGERDELALSAPEPEPVASVARPHFDVSEHESPPDALASPREPAGEGLPQWPFWTVAAATVGAGLVTAVSYVDTLDQQRRYEAQPTRSGYRLGIESEQRTHILLGATGALAIGTALLAVFTDFDAERAPEAGLALAPDGAAVTWGRHFQ